MTGRYLEDFAVAQTFGSGREGCVDSGLVELCDFFAPRKARGESLVLATIVRSEGSTYARILFSESGDTIGLLSDGCL
jgi:hypothetical protein